MADLPDLHSVTAAQNALRSAQLLLKWVGQGDEGDPDPDVLDLAVQYARLAEKQNHRPAKSP